MIKLPEKISYVINTLQKNGFEAYIVGGCVRDYLLGKIPNDFDITTNAEPENVISLFSKTIPTGIKHGTVTVIIEDEPIEVTTFRIETDYTDMRHPKKISFVKNIKEDLARRDFTINAMAYNEQSGLIDFFGGIDDLNDKILRAVGDPKKRFSEDALRILRLFRFSCVLGFEIENNTLLWAKKLSCNLKTISKERIFSELEKAILGDFSKNISPLIECNGLEFLGITHIDKFKIIKSLNNNKPLCFFSFLYSSDCNIQKTLSLLNTSNALKEYSFIMEKLLNSPIPKTKPEIKEMLSFSSVKMFNDYLILKGLISDNIENVKTLFKEILANNEPYLISHLEITGNDLLKLGFKGEEVGNKLKFLLNQVIIEPTLNHKVKLISKLGVKS